MRRPLPDKPPVPTGILIATSPRGRRVAIEYVDVIQPAPIYKEDFLIAHQENIQDRQYEMVVWVCANAQEQHRFSVLITRLVEELRQEGRWDLDRNPGQPPVFQFSNKAPGLFRCRLVVHVTAGARSLDQMPPSDSAYRNILLLSKIAACE